MHEPNDAQGKLQAVNGSGLIHPLGGRSPNNPRNARDTADQADNFPVFGHRRASVLPSLVDVDDCFP
jgi:hypothetical protein